MRFVITLEDQDVERLKAACDRYGVDNPANMVRELVSVGLARDEIIWERHAEKQAELRAAFKQRGGPVGWLRAAWSSLREIRF